MLKLQAKHFNYIHITYMHIGRQFITDDTLFIVIDV